MKDWGRVLLVIAVMVIAVFLAGNQRCIDILRKVVFDLLVLLFVTAAGAYVVERATGQ